MVLILHILCVCVCARNPALTEVFVLYETFNKSGVKDGCNELEYRLQAGLSSQNISQQALFTCNERSRQPTYRELFSFASSGTAFVGDVVRDIMGPLRILMPFCILIAIWWIFLIQFDSFVIPARVCDIKIVDARSGCSFERRRGDRRNYFSSGCHQYRIRGCPHLHRRHQVRNLRICTPINDVLSQQNMSTWSTQSTWYWPWRTWPDVTTGTTRSVR